MKCRLLQTLVVLTFFLLFAGGLVTSTDSGLAVPDWPLSFGGLFPPMASGILFEHTHRVIASAAGLLTLILTIWIGCTETRPWVRWLAIAALGAVVLQGILGGMTVLHGLPAPLSIAHACLGPTFFSLLVALTIPLGTVLPVPPLGPSPRGPSPMVSWGGVAAVVFIQILLGAIVRHTDRGIWIHVGWAFGIPVAAALAVSRSWSRTALLLGLLVALEFFIGIGAFIFTRIEGFGSQAGRVLFPTIHQMHGALILAMAVALALKGTKWQERPS